MDLHLTPDPHDRGPFRLFVHGALVAEYSVGLAQDRDSLYAEVTAARALQALAQEVRAWSRQLTMPAPVSTSSSRTDFARGLGAGLQDRTVPHPYPGVPPVPPEHTAPYRQGWEHGQALRRCLAVIEAAEKEAGHEPAVSP